MTDDEVKTKGALLAQGITLSYLIALIRKDDPASIDELHTILTGHVESAMSNSRINQSTLGVETINTMEVAAVGELDTILGAAKRILRRHEED